MLFAPWSDKSEIHAFPFTTNLFVLFVYIDNSIDKRCEISNME